VNILVSNSRGVAIVIPSGRLDSNNSVQAQEAIAAEIENGARRFVIDFAKTRYISSAGLRVILKALQSLRRVDGDLALCNANEQIREVLEISNFLSMVECHDSLEAAIQRLSVE
jgi:anti-anti-sigma factor